MKKFGRQCAALAVALALALTAAQPALASYALGTELTAWSTPLGTGTTLTSQSLWSASRSDLRTEHYVTYSPNAMVKPVVFSGTYVASTNAVQAAAAQLEEQGWRVAAAINGGFFNTDGTIVGMLMTEGVLRSLDVANYTMLGFTGDGQVFLDESSPSITAAWTGLEPVQIQQPQPDPAAPADPGAQPDPADPGAQPDPAAPADPGAQPIPTPEPVYQPVERSFRVAGFNAYRNRNYAGSLFLYNKDFSSRVASGGPNVSAIIRPLEEGGMTMNSAMAFEVVSVTDTTQEGVEFNGVIPEGCWMLYAEDHNNAGLLDALRALTPGTRMTIAVSGADARWENAAYGVSGMYTLLRGGQIVDGLPTAANPYTAVGLKADGTAVFYTIDGRQSGWSVGASYAQVAQRLQELGCVSAVALDGGGSTALGATLPGSTEFELVNRPSETGRRVNNTIALVAPQGAAIFQPGAYVTAQERVVLAGSQLSLSAAAYDSAGRPVEPGSLSWTATGGTVAGDGSSAVYTAGNTAGVYAVAAGPEGEAASVQVVDKLTSLSVTRKDTGDAVTSLLLKPGDQVDLNVAGMWWNLPVAMGEDAVSWAVDAAIGSVDPSGRFTAGTELAEGSITITAGQATATIPVKVYQDCPFTDITEHWSRDYVIRMYGLGLTTGYGQPDGTALYRPGGKLTRAELLAFVTRVLGVDESAYYTVETPFADNTSIPNWAQNYVQAMYTLGVLKGSLGSDGRLYANVNGNVTREETMTILGRVLAASEKSDLSVFPDGAAVSDWAAPHVQTLVALNVVGGSNGYLNPRDEITRAEIAKLLVEIYPMEKALLIPRLDLMS